MTTERHRIYVGLDAGGSSTRLVASTGSSEETVSLTGPGVTLQRSGLQRTAHLLAGLLRKAVQEAGGGRLHAVCAGVAGAGLASDQQALAEELRELLGAEAPTHLHVTHDAHVALEGALEGGSGLVVTAGTGSIVLARTEEGSFIRAGGWGYLLGDEGSGYAIGLEGLRAVAQALDGGPATELSSLLHDREGIATRDDLIHRVYRAAWPLQHVAPLVIQAAERGDAVAVGIVEKQVRGLAQQADWLVRRSPPIVPQVALLGGLTQAPSYRDMLEKALLARLPDWSIQAPRSSAVAGALRVAREMPAPPDASLPGYTSSRG